MRILWLWWVSLVILTGWMCATLSLFLFVLIEGPQLFVESRLWVLWLEISACLLAITLGMTSVITISLRLRRRGKKRDMRPH